MKDLFIAQSKESAVDTVINKIKQLLLENKLKLGDKLPSENEISQGLCVSRGSVREAMKILAALGIIEIKPGNGTYIVDKPKDTLLDPLLFNFLLISPNISELTEFRKLFEEIVIRSIISHFDENQKERSLLKNNVDELKRLQKINSSPIILADNDLEFHRLLGEASFNSLIKKIYAFVMDFFKNSIINTHINQKSGNIALKTHIDILTAIENKDENMIKDAINTSVNFWENLQSGGN